MNFWSLNFIKTRNAFVPYLYIQSCKHDLFLNKLTWYDVQGFDIAVNHSHIYDDDDEIVFIFVLLELMIRRLRDPQIL